MKKWIAIFLFMLFVTTPTLIYGANNDLLILKQAPTQYLIYINGLEEQNFSFEFANDVNIDKTDINFNLKNSAFDTQNRHVAYIDNPIIINSFSAPTENTYLFVKVGDQYVIDGEEIDLADIIEETELDLVKDITKQILVDTTRTQTQTATEGNTTTTITTGKIVITDEEEGTYFYQLIKADISENYTRLMNLAKEINLLNANSNFYSVLKTYKDFVALYNNLMPETDWIQVENMEIMQPEDSKDGEEYILWLKRENAEGNVITDAQFLEAFEEHSESAKKEEVVTQETVKLPVTYDNPVLIIVLLTVVALIIVAVIVRNRIRKNEKD